MAYARKDLREQAVALKIDGHSVPSIARRLGVARSTAWEWTKHIPLADDAAEGERRRAHAKAMTDARWERHRAQRAAEEERLAVESAGVVGALDERDLLMLGALMYWCEGAKVKPWNPSPRVIFVNSDARLVRLFLAFLRSAGVGPEEMIYRVHIHETADAVAAVAWWSRQTGVPTAAFGNTTLKRHNPKTNRRHRGADYHGCLRVEVRRSGPLYRRIAAAVDAMMGRPQAEPEDETG